MEASKTDVVIGSYLIDNGVPTFVTNSTRAMGIAFIIIGLLALFAGTFLFIGPRLAYSMNEAKYKNIDDKIYKVDAKSLREKERADMAAREKLKKGTTAAPKDGTTAAKDGTATAAKDGSAATESKDGNAPAAADQSGVSAANKPRSFTARMNEYKALREKAAEQGITMAEMREQERVQNKIKETSKLGMGDVRSKIGGEQVEIVAKPTPVEEVNVKHAAGEPEIDLLDSVKKDNAFERDQFVQKAVTEQQNAPDAKGVLSRIKKVMGEEDDESDKKD